MKVVREYKTHHYISEWVKSDYYCPNCASKCVWVEDGDGDYYTGPNHVCANCGQGFSLPYGTYSNGTETEQKIVDQLRSGTTLKPTTPKGN